MDGESEKACSTCGAVKPLDAFYRNSATTDGRQARCRDCHREAVGRYRRDLRARNADRTPDPDRRKRCSRCGEDKRGRDFHRNRSTADGLHGACRTCNTPTPAQQRAVDQRRRFRAYQVTPDEVDALIAFQDGRCAICRAAFDGRDFHVDHDHLDDTVRGLLCRACNTALGLLQDEPERLRRALAYLADPPLRSVRGKRDSGGRYRT